MGIREDRIKTHGLVAALTTSLALVFGGLSYKAFNEADSTKTSKEVVEIKIDPQTGDKYENYSIKSQHTGESIGFNILGGTCSILSGVFSLIALNRTNRGIKHVLKKHNYLDSNEQKIPEQDRT